MKNSIFVNLSPFWVRFGISLLMAETCQFAWGFGAVAEINVGQEASGGLSASTYHVQRFATANTQTEADNKALSLCRGYVSELNGNSELFKHLFRKAFCLNGG